MQVSSFSRQDVMDFLATWQRPDAAILGMVGQPLLQHSLLATLCTLRMPVPGMTLAGTTIPLHLLLISSLQVLLAGSEHST